MSPRKELVRSMFDEISPRYDLLNHLLSFGIDRYWRKHLVRQIRLHFPDRLTTLEILDVATGTGDLAIAASRLHPARIDGIDVSLSMLEEARKKIIRKDLAGVIRFREGEAEKIPMEENTYDVVMVAFGVRNFEDLTAGIAEMRRVLRPGGLLLILEFSQPRSFPVKPLYKIYSKIIPLLGRLVSRHQQAYTYLPETVKRFPYGKAFLEILAQARLTTLRQIPLSGGITTLYLAEK